MRLTHSVKRRQIAFASRNSEIEWYEISYQRSGLEVENRSVTAIELQNALDYRPEYLLSLQKLLHLIRVITNITLALLILTSSTGLVVNRHFCQDQLKSIAFFRPAKTCHQIVSKKVCPMHAEPDQSQDRKGCCDDETEWIKNQEELINSCMIEEKETPSLDLTTLLFPAPSKPFPVHKQYIHYLNYKPPLLSCNYTIELQVFLC